MSEQENNKDKVIEGEVTESTAETQSASKAQETVAKKESTINSEVLTRILVTVLFALIGWVSLWVFGVVVLVQFGFLLITGNLNKNLKAFNGELGDYLADILKYVSFQREEKPFPFQSWHYDDDNKETGAPAK
ncbi:MAG: DUF4389 domain-containing protein [Xanthomonadales bacterium]|nr:DUF4389 domain-containing protein [Xanthomonadales bacterium]